MYENVSGGRGRRASSRRAPISQRVSDSEAREIRRNAKENPRPTVSAPEDDSLEAMKSRFRAETDAENAEKEAKKPKRVPSRGIGASERVLRKGKKSTPGGTAQQRVTELGRRSRELGQPRYSWPRDEERSRRISAALKNRDKWGTPEAAREEYVIDYLVTEGYTDNYDSAIAIYESMSGEWLDTILEVTGGGKVTRDNYRERGMKQPPHIKTYMKKIKVENEIEGREANIRAATGAEHDYGYPPDPEPDEDFGGRRPSRREVQSQRRKNRFANEVIRNSPRLKKLKTRWQKLHDVDQRW